MPLLTDTGPASILEDTENSGQGMRGRGGTSSTSRPAPAHRPLELWATLVVDQTRFNHPEQIEARIHAVPLHDRGSLETALLYLYDDDGPVNLPRDRLKAGLPHLDAAEQLLIRWLYANKR